MSYFKFFMVLSLVYLNFTLIDIDEKLGWIQSKQIDIEVTVNQINNKLKK